MIRKSLFWGLTIILVIALVSLIIRGRQMEKEQESQPAEVVQQAPVEPIRALSPQDLEITDATMKLNSDRTVRHEVELKNHGAVRYSGILLRFVYQNRSGVPLEAKTYELEKSSIPPKGTFRASNIVIREIPSGTAKFQASVQYADMQVED